MATVIKKKEAPEINKIAASKGSFRITKHKHVFWTFILVVLIVLFFTFGLFARYIFGADSSITKTAETNIVGFINVVHLAEKYVDTLVKAISAIFISLIVIWILLFILRIVGSRGSRRKTISRLLSSFVKYIGAIIIMMIVLSVWGVDTGTLLASVGLIGLVIGFGAQSLVSDILAGLFIVFENCFQVGDIITVKDFRGMVVDMGLRTTQIKDTSDNVMIINNSELKSLINMSQHGSFAVCDIAFEYSENIEKVEQIVAINSKAIAKKLEKMTSAPVSKGVIDFTDRGVVLRFVAGCSENDRIQLNRDFAREMKLLFDRYKIKIAVPRVSVTKD